MTDYDECNICKSKFCTSECFNIHVGSTIALQKLFVEMNIKGHIVGENYGI